MLVGRNTLACEEDSPEQLARNAAREWAEKCFRRGLCLTTLGVVLQTVEVCSDGEPFSPWIRVAPSRVWGEEHKIATRQQLGRASSGDTGEVRGGAGGWARVKSGFIFPILRLLW